MLKNLSYDANIWAMEDSYVIEPDTTKNIQRRFQVMLDSKSKVLQYELWSHIYDLSCTHVIPT